ncbi:glycosyltransferase family protein [Paenibacillus sp. FSL M7-0656]|uniref:glycosyltransferase family protein n=1 Tax=Paenibacillus sp. FSL M7-0656 TaxID=2921534 RepID=UPI0030FA74DF
MNITAIIQARLGSSRLPAKVMKTLEDKSVLGHVITRVRAIPLVNNVVVATTNAIEDEEICKEAKRYKVDCYKGSINNVLKRYYEAAKLSNADVIVRITSDCPLIDPNISNKVIKYFINSHIDYLSSGLSNTFPRGLDTEVFTFQALEKAHEESTKEYELEHVTPYIYENPDLFRIRVYSNEQNFSHYRLTLDTIEDWKLISEIYKKLYTGRVFGLDDTIHLLQSHPELALINSQVKQKELGE